MVLVVVTARGEGSLVVQESQTILQIPGESAHRSLILVQLVGPKEPPGTGLKDLTAEEEQEASCIRVPSHFNKLPIERKLTSFEAFTKVIFLCLTFAFIFHPLEFSLSYD